MVATEKNELFKPSPEFTRTFFKQAVPFSHLPESELEEIIHQCSIDFYPKDSRVLTAGESEIQSLYLIYKGAVNTSLEDDFGEITLKDMRGEGEYFGALGIIQNSRSNFNVDTAEDSFFILLPKNVFLGLIKNKPFFAQYYLKSFSDHLAKTAYHELRHQKLKRRSSEDLLLFSNTVGDLIIKSPIMIDEESTIQKAALTMSEQRVGSLIVHDRLDKETSIGIITDRDLRLKVVASGIDINEPVRRIMSSPLITVLSQTVCFDALITMLTREIHHLPVERKGRIIGVITSDDIVSLQGSSPYYLFKEIVSQTEITGLYPLARKVPDIIRNLLKEGGKTKHITNMIAIINDHIISRMLELLEQELGAAPVKYCWLLMGSEGRREQTFKTDQDNALIYEDPVDERQAEMADAYFSYFTKRAIEHLVNCGYPPCPGEVMANNPKWCRPYSEWQRYFDRWISAPDPQEVINATIFFDFKSGYGHDLLAKNLRSHLVEKIKRKDIFLFHLARHALTHKVPLSLFRNLIVEKDGQYKNRLDLKHKGILPITDFARILSLRHGIRETNTLSRLRVLVDEGHLEQPVYKMIRDSYELMMQQRLIHQLNTIKQGGQPDNHIDPADLTDIERRMLKESFRVLERMQNILESMFPTP